VAQISAIQVLRAAAALTVVVGHAQTEAMVAAATAGAPFAPLTLLPWGAGVDLFFVISGFIMVVSSERLFAAPGGAFTFLGRRLTRILPLWWLCATLYLGLQILAHRTTGKPLPPLPDIAAAYALWPTDLFGDGVPRPFYTLGWTLEYEMAFYVLFAAAIAWPRGRAVLATAGALVAIVIAGALLPPHAAPLVLVSRPIVLEFVLGMGIALLWRHGVRLPLLARLALGIAAVACLSWDGMASATRPSDWITPNDFTRVLAWGLPAAALVAAAALGRVSTATNPISRVAILLGDASYALYLTHPFVVGTLRRAWSAAHLDTKLGWAPMVACALGLACLVAILVHLLLERPLGALLRQRPAQAPERTAADPAIVL
jgi:exopolysaccharide production protein ExoZ